MKYFLSIALTALSLQAADILDLVGLLDRNDTKGFEYHVQTLTDANSVREDNKKSILMYACWMGNFEAVRYLISKGADVTAQDDGGATALHLAIWKGHSPIALYLLEHGASATAMSKEGMSPLDIAIMKENREVISAIDQKTPKLKSLLK